MGRASVETLMPIDTWAKIMGVSYFEFNQLGQGFPKPDTKQCPHVFMQFPWQNDFLAREEIAQTIQIAENLIAQQLGYYPAPKYIVDEVQPFPRPSQRDLYGLGRTNRGQWKAVGLDWKKVQGGGVLARTSIALHAAVTYSDKDGDGVNETFTASAATTVTDINEIGVYFTDTDRNTEPIAEQWRIRPVRVSIAGGTVTIVGHSSLLVVPDKTLVTNPANLDVTNVANFVTEVEIYRVYRDDTVDNTNNTSKQGYAMWETIDCQTPPCGVQYAAVCIGARDANLGFVSVDYQPAPVCQGVAPDRVSLSYLAGEPLINGQMNPDMADIVAHLATAMLPSEKCGCDRAQRIIAYWRQVAPAPGEGLRETVTGLGHMENPFGTQRGAIYAWQKVKQLRILA